MRTIEVSATYVFKKRLSKVTLTDESGVIFEKSYDMCTKDTALFLGIAEAVGIFLDQEDVVKICCDSWDVVVKAKAADIGIFLPEDHPNFDELSEAIIQAEMLLDSLPPAQRGLLITKC